MFLAVCDIFVEARTLEAMPLEELRDYARVRVDHIDVGVAVVRESLSASFDADKASASLSFKRKTTRLVDDTVYRRSLVSELRGSRHSKLVCEKYLTSLRDPAAERATAPNAAGVALTTGSCGQYADSRRLDVPIRQVRDAPLAASAIPEKFPPKPSGR